MANVAAWAGEEQPGTVWDVTDDDLLRSALVEGLVALVLDDLQFADEASVDLWQELDEAVSRHKTTWVWTKGHASHPDNNRADELANLAAREQRSGDRVVNS